MTKNFVRMIHPGLGKSASNVEVTNGTPAQSFKSKKPPASKNVRVIVECKE